MVKLIKSGFHKDRTILAVFLLIIVIAAFILHSGIFASLYPRLYDEYAEEQGLSDYFIVTNAEDEKLSGVLDGNAGISSYEKKDVVFLRELKYTTSKCTKEKSDEGWMIQRLRDFDGYYFEKRDDSVSGRKIYLNAYTASSNNLCTGDKITLDTSIGKYEFTVAGIYQHLLMGNSYYSISVAVEDDTFAELKEAEKNSDNTEMQLLFINGTENTDIDDTMQKAVISLKSDGRTYVYGYSKSLGREGYTVIVNILAGFMSAFALILIMICVIMIIFTLNNNISRDIVNIGALRAVGYTVGQIRAALTAEYVILGFAGAAAGIILSYAVFPYAEQMFIRKISGIIWKNKFYPVITSGVLAVVVLVIITAAYFSTRKIKHLHPATALRFGLKSNSFKKNHFPLSDTKGELNLLLALKSSRQNPGQNITVFFIIAAVAFVTVFSGLLYYNTKVDITSFQRMVQGDSPDIYVALDDPSYDSARKAIDEISNVDGVSQAYGLSSVNATIDDSEVLLIYVSNPDYVYCGIYEGEIMREENEAVIGSTVAEKFGVGVGDEITVSYGENSKRYLITGLQQSVMNTRLYTTDKGAQALGINTEHRELRVRAENATAEKVDEVVERIEALNGLGINAVTNNYREIRSNENTPVFAVAFVVLIMTLLSVATVMLVIRLLLKTVFIKKEREFGIKKAVGFTSGQLRYQLSLSLMPTTITASVFGSVLGYLLLNPLFTLILGGYGIKNADLLRQPAIMAITAAAVTVTVFASSFIMSGRMKKLSAYKLIQE